MNLEFKRFQREYYSEYASWFSDPELNHHLGPMDNDWLEAVLAEAESAGMTWAVFRSTELIAVVETIFDSQNRLPTVISAIAVKPALRGQGIGTIVLQELLALDQRKGRVEHVAYIASENHAAQRYVEKLGFRPVPSTLKDRYLEFRYNPQAIRS